MSFDPRSHFDYRPPPSARLLKASRKTKNSRNGQRQRFIDAAREDEAEFNENPKRLMTAKPDQKRPIGWYVRVTTGQIHDGVYDTVLYIVGYPTPAEAEEAVREVRSAPGETYEVLPGAITPDRGPQPAAGEVRLLAGAV